MEVLYFETKKRILMENLRGSLYGIAIICISFITTLAGVLAGKKTPLNNESVFIFVVTPLCLILFIPTSLLVEYVCRPRPRNAFEKERLKSPLW